MSTSYRPPDPTVAQLYDAFEWLREQALNGNYHAQVALLGWTRGILRPLAADTVLPDEPPEAEPVCPLCQGTKLVKDHDDRYEQPCPDCFTLKPLTLNAALRGLKP